MTIAAPEPEPSWVPVAHAVHRATRTVDAEVRLLRYRYRGWNRAEASPVSDAIWALAQIRVERPGLPIVLVGHSMGGRAALRVAGDPGTSCCAGPGGGRR